MLKREIKKIIEEMKIGEEVTFHSNDNDGWRTDTIKRYEDDYTIYSIGSGWSDQEPEYFTQKQVIKAIWTEKPYTCY